MNIKVIKTFVLFLVVFLAVGCSGSPKWVDGVYSGASKGFKGDISLTVEISNGKIANIEFVEHTESPSITDKAFDNIPRDIIAKQSTEVDTISGATTTSDAIIKAVEDALEKAK